LIIFVAILALSLIGFFIHLFVSKKAKTPLRIVELLLLYQLVFSVGLISILAFLGLTFIPEYVAQYTGWPACPWQQQLANVNLGYGVLGILCIWKRDLFWLATIIGLSIWLIGDAIDHIADMMINHNYAPGNIGITLYSDIIVPLVLLILYFLYKYLQKKQTSELIEAG
jgi:hypothetical protein